LPDPIGGNIPIAPPQVLEFFKSRFASERLPATQDGDSTGGFSAVEEQGGGAGWNRDTKPFLYKSIRLLGGPQEVARLGCASSLNQAAKKSAGRQARPQAETIQENLPYHPIGATEKHNPFNAARAHKRSLKNENSISHNPEPS